MKLLIAERGTNEAGVRVVMSVINDDHHLLTKLSRSYKPGCSRIWRSKKLLRNKVSREESDNFNAMLLYAIENKWTIVTLTSERFHKALVETAVWLSLLPAVDQARSNQRAISLIPPQYDN